MGARPRRGRRTAGRRASTRALAESLGALQLTLTDTDLARIEAAVPEGEVTGDRYDAAQMAALDSERG